MKKLSLALGIACPVACKGCYFAFPFDQLRESGFENKLISHKEVSKFIRYLVINHGLEKVTLCGGDPLSHPDMHYILEALKALPVKVSLDTVGTNLLKDAEMIFPVKMQSKYINVSYLKDYIDILGIPLDGSTQELCATFRVGRKDLFKETLDVLKKANAVDIPVSINTVVHKQNIDDLNNVLDILLSYHNIFRMQLFQFTPIGQMAFSNWNHFMISDDEFWGKISELRDTYGHRVLLDPKSNEMRINEYFMVDCFGRMYVPEIFGVEKGEAVKSDLQVLGNIKEETLYPEMLSKFKALKDA